MNNPEPRTPNPGPQGTFACVFVVLVVICLPTVIEKLPYFIVHESAGTTTFGAEASKLILLMCEGKKELDEQVMKDLELLNVLHYLLPEPRQADLIKLPKKAEKSTNKSADSMAVSVATLVSSIFYCY